MKMLYRRKIILAILQVWGKELPATDFQKILFLFTRKQEQPSFNFVPYNFGCFSFISYADKRTMIQDGVIDDESKWIKKDDKDYLSLLKDDDKNKLNELYNDINKISGNDLVRYVYRRFPYYAINSEIADRILSAEDKKEVDSARKRINKKNVRTLFTIGYEGKDLDEYLNMLVKNNIKVLYDVRKNALSMKYGFSKKQLEENTKKLGIKYIHDSDLGIDSEKRKKLNTLEDYQLLFSEYEKKILPHKSKQLQSLYKTFLEEKRIALTCFEKDVEFCHRGKIVEALSGLPNWSYSIDHL